MTQTKEPGSTIGMVPPWRQWLPFAVIANLEDARRIARRAAITGYLLLIVGIIDMALSLAGYVMLPRTIIDLTGSSMVAVVLLQSVGFVLLWFLVSRVATARGYICAALLAVCAVVHRTADRSGPGQLQLHRAAPPRP